jgi:Flp pilus assembly protein TadG
VNRIVAALRLESGGSSRTVKGLALKRRYRLLRDLWRDRSGNYTIIFGLLGTLLVVAAGGSIDLTRYLEARSRLRDTVDSAALMVAGRYKAGETTEDALNSAARAILDQTFAGHDATIGSVAATAGTASLTLTADASVRTFFLPIIGLSSMTTAATSSVAWSTTSIEVAMVLDTTGSMADNDKIGQLKTAATSMVDSVFSKAGTSSTVKFGIVPFSHFVNVGPGNAAATWIDQGAATRSVYYDAYFSTHINRLTTYTSLGKSWKGCVETRPAPYDVDDTAPTIANPNTLFVPSFHPDEPDSANAYYGNNYLGDKLFFGDDWTRMMNAAKYTNPVNKDYSNSTLYSNYSAPKGPEFLCSSNPLTRLSTSSATVKTAIAALTPAGSTNIPEGLAWGWRVLSPKGPFADGASYTASDNRKVLVVLTDGTNAINTFPTALGGAYSSWGFPASARLGANAGVDQRDGLDAKTRTICTKVKAAGIQIYTIGLMIADTAGQQLLADCSSGTGFYYDSPNATQLQSIFDDIAKKISKLRIAS